MGFCNSEIEAYEASIDDCVNTYTLYVRLPTCIKPIHIPVELDDAAMTHLCAQLSEIGILCTRQRVCDSRQFEMMLIKAVSRYDG